MKSKLLLSLSFAIALTANIKAQTTKSPADGAYKIDARAALKDELRLKRLEQSAAVNLQTNPQTVTLKHAVIRHKSQTNQSNAKCSDNCTVTPICHAPNGLTVLARSRSNINYNKDINT